MRNTLRSASVLVAAALLTTMACGASGPRAVIAGEDQCNYCRMEVSEPRFATQVILTTGKAVIFDSVECLAGYVRGNPESSIKAIWVANASAEGVFVRAEDAGYLLDASLRGPMGRAVAFATPADAERERQRLGGVAVSWRAILSDSAGITAHGH